jgi:hypothetical protein
MVHMLAVIISSAIYKAPTEKSRNEKDEIFGSFSNILRPIKFMIKKLKHGKPESRF